MILNIAISSTTIEAILDYLNTSNSTQKPTPKSVSVDRLLLEVLKVFEIVQVSETQV
jgi:hypothetical protein